VVLAMLTYLPLYLTVVRGASPSQVGLMMLPMTATSGISAFLCGQAIARLGIGPAISMTTMTATSLCLLVFALFAEALSPAGLTVLFVCYALTLGGVMPIAQILVQVASDRSMLGAATASVQLFRAVGTALGPALVGLVLFGALSVIDPDLAGRFNAMLASGPAALADLGEAAQHAAQHGVALAFRAAFLCISGIALGGAIFAWSIPLRRI
jgi:predicted MFS family arabinose efflux permease